MVVMYVDSLFQMKEAARLSCDDCNVDSMFQMKEAAGDWQPETLGAENSNQLHPNDKR